MFPPLFERLKSFLFFPCRYHCIEAKFCGLSLKINTILFFFLFLHYFFVFYFTWCWTNQYLNLSLYASSFRMPDKLVDGRQKKSILNPFFNTSSFCLPDKFLDGVRGVGNWQRNHVRVAKAHIEFFFCFYYERTSM